VAAAPAGLPGDLLGGRAGHLPLVSYRAETTRGVGEYHAETTRQPSFAGSLEGMTRRSPAPRACGKQRVSQ
jgi:hypothetical protein